MRPEPPELRDGEAPVDLERVCFALELAGFVARFVADFVLRPRFVFPALAPLFVAAPLPFARGWLVALDRFVARFALDFFALVLRALRAPRPCFVPELRLSLPCGIVHLQESSLGSSPRENRLVRLSELHEPAPLAKRVPTRAVWGRIARTGTLPT